MRQTLVTDFEFWDSASGLEASLWLSTHEDHTSVPLALSELAGSSEVISEDRGHSCDMIECIRQEAGAENCGEVGAIAKEAESRRTGPKIPQR